MPSSELELPEEKINDGVAQQQDSNSKVAANGITGLSVAFSISGVAAEILL
jgi:hypothetical protein